MKKLTLIIIFPAIYLNFSAQKNSWTEYFPEQDSIVGYRKVNCSEKTLNFTRQSRKRWVTYLQKSI